MAARTGAKPKNVGHRHREHRLARVRKREADIVERLVQGVEQI
jgi:hypothetical protein